MYLMISHVTNAMGCSVVESMPLSSVVMLTVFNITASTAGQRSTPCQASTATDRW